MILLTRRFKDMIFKYKKTITIKKLENELNIVSEKVEKLHLPKGFFEFILYTISELIANVKEHAITNKASIALRISEGGCLICIADKGIGLKQSYLSKQIYVKDDFSAIEFALSGLSTKNLQERGFGLYSIRKFTEKLAGEMVVESGSARALIQKNKINFQNLKEKIRGVTIQIKTPVKEVDFYKIIT